MSLIKNDKVALITGTSSNLGINIAFRMLEQLPSEENITLIVTSRTLAKAREVINDIKAFNRKIARSGQLEFDYILVDFADMISVLSAYYDLTKRYTKIDYLVINAAQGVYLGLDWIGAIKQIMANPLDGVTHPTYKIQRVGVKSSDELGLVFQANVFGPYYLIHRIKPLLKNGGKIVWISSVMSKPSSLSFDDLQLVKSHESYEGSKRVLDLMHVGTYEKLKVDHGIIQYVVQPGIFTSFSFFKFLNVFTYYGMVMLFYFARMIGSQLHNISGYNAANAPVSCIVSDQIQDKKVGSASSRWGQEYLTYDNIDPTGAEDVVAYLESLCKQWDETLKDQITDTRQP
jgi:3-keto steroid reductase